MTSTLLFGLLFVCGHLANRLHSVAESSIHIVEASRCVRCAACFALSTFCVVFCCVLLCCVLCAVCCVLCAVCCVLCVVRLCLALGALLCSVVGSWC